MFWLFALTCSMISTRVDVVSVVLDMSMKMEEKKEG